MLEGLNQFLVVLHCCPRQQDKCSYHPSPLRSSELHVMAFVRQGDEMIQTAIGAVEVIVMYNTEWLFDTVDNQDMPISVCLPISNIDTCMIIWW